jgi:WD40 repeat protein
MSDAMTRLNVALEGRYRIQHPLGEGGMATVYLADDLRHERKVALKVLKPELAAVVGAERFLAEIKTTANLQHPNILPLFDSGEADSFLFYVMPYVEGESLRERLERDRQLPVDEAVRMATDLSEALDHAHRRGVVHRDIKPANILIQDGRPVIADFGIALAVGSAGGARLTETGLSLGTPYYMSPEQATGDQAVGPASDIYALGCVLYELLVGEPPYVGPTAQAVLGRIIVGGPVSARERRPSIPFNVDGAIQKALERIPADRFVSASELSKALNDPGFRHGAVQADAAATRGPWKMVSALLFVVAVALGGMFLMGDGGQDPIPVLHVGLGLPEGEGLSYDSENRVAISPDGRLLAYVGMGQTGAAQLWVRDLSDLSSRPIRGTEGACCLAFSPDGQSLAYMTLARELRVTSLEGPPMAPLTGQISRDRYHWGDDGFIYFGGGIGLRRVPERGGEVEEISTPDRSVSETDHINAFLLPNGKGILYTVAYGSSEATATYVLDRETGERTRLLAGHSAIYSPTGHLLFVSPDEDLMAVPFDLGELAVEGNAFTVAQGIAGPLGSGDLALSGNGTLIYVAGEVGSERVVWTDRQGISGPIDADWIRDFENVSLSPDGGRLAVSIVDSEGYHLWLRSLPAGTPTRFTLEGTINIRPRWSPGGDEIVFVSDQGETPNNLQRKPIRGGTAQTYLDLDRSIWEAEWSPDQEYLVYRLGTPPTRDLFVKHVHPDSAGRTISASDEAEEVMPAVSPDGRWLAYQSSETGQDEIYVRPFPNIDDAKYPVSSGGGMEPRWNPAGGELFYRSLADELVSARVSTADGFEVLSRETLFSTSGYQRGDEYCCHPTYDVDGDGSRFLMIQRTGGPGEVVMIQNVFRMLRNLSAGN